MDITSDHAEVFHTAVRRALVGAIPDAEAGSAMGPLAPIWDDLVRAWQQGGTAGFRRALEAGMRDPRYRIIGSLIVPQENAPSAPTRPSVPPLPEPATEIYADLAPCAPLLTEYVNFARQAAPVAPTAFHEAMGLAVLQTTIARRLVCHVGVTRIYPNMYFLLLAPSAVYGKTTALQVPIQWLDVAGLAHLRLPERMTPEAMVQQLSLHLPHSFDAWAQQARELWLQERATAGQRLWLLDEASDLFDGFRRDYNTGMLGLLLKLYDSPDLHTEETIGRGRIAVYNVSLGFLGMTTPSAMTEHLRQPLFWHNGLWSRYVMLLPDHEPVWKFLPDALEFPPPLITGLRRLYELFPVPVARVVDGDNSPGSQRRLEVLNAEPPSPVRLQPRVRAAWEAYTKAVRHDLLVAGEIDERLNANYGRFGNHAIKVAMTLAAVDAAELPVTVEPRHFARAQRIVEGWRGMLHQVWDMGMTTQEAHVTERMLAVLGSAGSAGMLTREVYRALHLPGKEARGMLEELQRGGQVERFERLSAANHPLEAWRLAR